MPHAGDELHHFGWNACSSASARTRRIPTWNGATRRAGHPLVAHSHPRHEAGSPAAALVKVIEPETFARRTGYAAPHTVHCGPDGILSARSARLTQRAGGHVPPRSGNVRRPWTLGARSRTAGTRLRRVVASRARHDGDQHLGYTQHGEERHRSRAAAHRQVRKQLHVWDMRRRRHLQELDLATSSRCPRTASRP